MNSLVNEPVNTAPITPSANPEISTSRRETELTEKLRRIARDYCESEGGCHGIDHAERVHEMALYIGQAMGADPVILSAAAWLHDIGRRDETRERGKICHAARGAELAAGILSGLDFKPETIAEITHCIGTHRYRNGNLPITLEAKILFDADKLDTIGAIGIGRAFLFAGQVGARLHNKKSIIDHTKPYSTEDTAYREFKVKMSKIKDLMLTPLGRKMAQDRHEFMVLFFKRLEMEINGE
ncbi:MAG: HD domain-containing protein [Proteobacteria bacterium]|nr:HD domain-containing protein [Pseudomonadota bacterium]MBU1714868.1 HD domain-containing protein [Pseudomonadota bacterium]